MRYYLLLIGAIPLVALGLDLYFTHQRDMRDDRLLATAEAFLLRSVGQSQGTPHVERHAISERSPGIWAVSGNLSFESDGEAAPKTYVVEIQELCGEPENQECWQPQRVTIADDVIEAADVAGAAASPAEGSAAEPDVTQEPAEPDGEPGLSVTADSATAESTGDKQAPALGQLGLANSEPTDSAALQETQQAAKGLDMSVEESLVWLIQDRLIQLGYSQGPAVVPSGIMDPNTRDAIQAFQADAGMAEDGAPSFALLDRLDSQLALAGSTPEPGFVGRDPEEESRADSGLLPMPKPSGDRGAAVIPPPPQAAAAPAAKPAPPAEPLAAPTAEAAPPAETAPAQVPQASNTEIDSLYAPDEPQDTGETAAAPQAPTQPVTAGGGSSNPAPTSSPDPQPQETQSARAPAEALPPAEDPAPAEAQPEVDESLVFLIQDRLNKLGYDEPMPIPLDGKLGPRTRAAITNYREKHTLAEEGPPSEALLKHMQSELANRSASAAGQPAAQ